MKQLKRIADASVGDIVYYHPPGKYKPRFMQEGYTVVREARPNQYIKLACNDTEALERHKAACLERGAGHPFRPIVHTASLREVKIPNDKDLIAYKEKLTQHHLAKYSWRKEVLSEP